MKSIRAPDRWCVGAVNEAGDAQRSRSTMDDHVSSPTRHVTHSPWQSQVCRMKGEGRFLAGVLSPAPILLAEKVPGGSPSPGNPVEPLIVGSVKQ